MPPRLLYPREGNSGPIVQEDGWAPEQVWFCVKNLALTGIRFPTVEPVSSRYTADAVSATYETNFIYLAKKQ
jgi:hypothetical protein